MKKLVSWLIVMMILCTSASAMEMASAQVDWSRLERYASFEEEGSVWSVMSNQAAAALARMSSETAPYSGYACFGLELTGDRDTGVVVPVLAVYYAGSLTLNGEAISIAADGVRYDMIVYREEIELGRNKAEKLTAPLDAEGLDMIRAMLTAEDVVVRLAGDQTFTMEPETKKTYASAREELSARSMEALESMLNEFEALGDYELWDLNEDWWTRTRGVEPAFRAILLPDEEEADSDEEALSVQLKVPMYALSRGSQGADVRALQELLIEKGYMQGRADGGYGDGTVRAVRAAQQWLGLAPTGMADETLIRLLDESAAVYTDEEIVEKAVSENGVELYTAEGLCELTVSRFWFADAVESAGGDRRTVSDRDNTLIVYEGTVKNLSQDDLDFYWRLSAVVRYGEYEYPCALVCERNEGATLSSTLTPLSEARLLAYAEIPENIAGEGDWTLEIQAGESSFSFN